jgi:hypothetical protein
MQNTAFKVLDCVVLKRDLPEHGLRDGDVGTVVETYPNGGLEVEFVTATGSTVAVVTLTEVDVRAATSADVLASRSSA